MANVRLFEVKGCKHCPNMKTKRTPRTGFGIDWWCTAVKPVKVVAGYIESPSEERKDGDFPCFCPLRVNPSS